MKGYIYLKRIEKGRLSRINVTKELSREGIYLALSIIQFILGFIFCIIFSLLASHFNNTLWLCGVFLGFLLSLSTAAEICLTEFIWKPSIYFLKDVLDVIKANEIVYLSDHVFSKLNFEQRIKLVERFIKFKNLENYEIIGGFAVAKKALYLSEDRLIDFLNPNLFGNITKIKRENLEVVESGTLILPKELIEAKEKPPEFVTHPDFVRLHSASLLNKDFLSTKKHANTLLAFSGINFIICFIITILCVTINPSGKFPFYTLVPFFLCFTTPGVAAIANHWLKKADKLLKIKDKIEKKSIVSISDDVFEGLSYEQRIIILESFISNKKIKNRKTVYTAFNTAIVEESLAKNLSYIDDFLEPNLDKKLHKINVEARTNCLYCGAPLKENAKYCGHCGIAKNRF